MWEEVVEKAGDAKAKNNLQPPSYIWEIDSKCPKSHCQSTKKDKEDTQQNHRKESSKNKEKAKSHNSSATNQPQTQDSKKRHGSR